LHDYILLRMSSILDFRGLYLCAAYLPANNSRRISTTVYTYEVIGRVVRMAE
jgi:hypothetical protein